MATSARAWATLNLDMKYYVTIGGSELTVDLRPNERGGFDASIVEGAETTLIADLVPEEIAGGRSIRIGGSLVDTKMLPSPSRSNVVWLSSIRSLAEVQSERDRRLSSARTDRQAKNSWVKSPMPGRVVKLLVSEGASVERGDRVVVVEAMKMQNELVSEGAGKVLKIAVNEGDAVEKNAQLVLVGS